MAITESDKVTPHWFTPASEEDEENPLEFKIKPLTGPQYLQVLNKQDLDYAITCGLLDWKNYFNKNGNQIQFRRTKLNGLPPSILSELANEICAISRLTGEEQKNS